MSFPRMNHFNISSVPYSLQYISNCLYRCRSQTKIVAHNIYIALWTAKINLHIDTHECCPGRIKLDISLITKTRAVLNLYFEEITLWGTIQPSWKSESVC